MLLNTANAAPVNILFILVDQLALRALGAAGNPYIHTPNIDTLASQGVLFTQSYCTAPVCSPSRSSLVTGCMPHETAVNYCDQPIRPGIPTIGETFQKAGYDTAYTGKWHLPHSHPSREESIPGFENLVLPSDGKNLHLGVHGDPLVVNEAIRFLERPRTKPFLLYTSLLTPHDICYWVMEREQEQFANFENGKELPPLPANFAVDALEPEVVQQCRLRDHYGPEMVWTHTWDELRWRKYLHVYYRLIEQVDAQIGRLLQTLRTTGQQDNTLIVLTSDHGEGTAGHQWVVKLMLYEEEAVVPLILSGKGIPSTGRVDRTHLVSGIDLPATMCDYAGILPAFKGSGKNLKPLVEKPELPGNPYVVAEFLPDTELPEMKGRMLRTARYKYVAFSSGERREMLFDLQNDPGENHNLAQRPDHKVELERHRTLLREWVLSTKDTFVF